MIDFHLAPQMESMEYIVFIVVLFYVGETGKSLRSGGGDRSEVGGRIGLGRGRNGR